MIEVRFHGRGGQGAVTSAELVAMAAIDAGGYAQSMPLFGPERRGAPVQAFLRVSDDKILFRGEVREPDIVVVLDETLFKVLDVTAGLKDDGLLVVNTTQSPEKFRKQVNFKGKLATIDALKIAMEELKVPITNTTMIGTLLKASELVSIEGVMKQIENRFNPKLAERNIKALKRAYEETTILE